MLDGLFCWRIDDFGKEAAPLIESSKLGITWKQFRPIHRCLIVSVISELCDEIHISVSTERTDRPSGLLRNHLIIPSHPLNLGHVIRFYVNRLSSLCHEVSELRLKLLSSISANPFAEASTISLSFPSGKFSS